MHRHTVGIFARSTGPGRSLWHCGMHNHAAGPASKLAETSLLKKKTGRDLEPFLHIYDILSCSVG